MLNPRACDTMTDVFNSSSTRLREYKQKAGSGSLSAPDSRQRARTGRNRPNSRPTYDTRQFTTLNDVQPNLAVQNNPLFGATSRLTTEGIPLAHEILSTDSSPRPFAHPPLL